MNDNEIRRASDEATLGLAKDMPLLMHGAGDVVPEQVDPDAAKYVAALTCQYISKLVDAALDSQSIMCDSSAPQQIPPMPYNTSKRKAGDDFFDQPLKQPKIKNKSSPALAGVTPQEWSGVTGVDFTRDRIRRIYVNGPSFLSTQNFIFPVCHDAYAYGRVTEIQAAKRSILPDLTDPVMMEMIREEGVLPHHRSKKDKKKSKKDDDEEKDEDESNSEDEEEAEDDETDDEAPNWPGLQDLIPFGSDM